MLLCLFGVQHVKRYINEFISLSIFFKEARCVAIRGPSKRGDFDELDQVLKTYNATHQHETTLNELNLEQYFNKPWPPED